MVKGHLKMIDENPSNDAIDSQKDGRMAKIINNHLQL
jgi:hypothetical protein